MIFKQFRFEKLSAASYLLGCARAKEAFIVDQTEDGSVWLTITAFSRPSAWYWWAVYPVLRLFQEFYTRRYLRALTAPIEK